MYFIRVFERLKFDDIVKYLYKAMEGIYLSNSDQKNKEKYIWNSLIEKNLNYKSILQDLTITNNTSESDCIFSADFFILVNFSLSQLTGQLIHPKKSFTNTIFS